MGEKFQGEQGPAPENLEDQKHRELMAAIDEETRIMKEIDNVLASTPDRAEAEKIVLEKWVPLMDEVRKRAAEAQKAWLDAMREAARKHLEDFDNNEGR